MKQSPLLMTPINAAKSFTGDKTMTCRLNALADVPSLGMSAKQPA